VASLDIPSASALQAEAGQEQSGVWLMDSGASCNFTPYSGDFVGGLSEPETSYVRIGDSTRLPVLGMGTVRVWGKGREDLTLTKVHYVPALHSRLLSVPHLTACGAEVTFKGEKCRVRLRGKLIIEGHQLDQEYRGL
jgi:hypothetical protein